MPSSDPVMVSLAVPVAVAAAIAAALALAVAVAALIRQNRVIRRYRLLLGGSGPRGESLERLLLQQAAQLEDLQAQVRHLAGRIDELAQAAVGHIQHVGVVRFQAFPDIGSDLSFSIALLDGRRNGFVLTSLYGRTESRVYAKPVQAGTSVYPLTEEERQAIQRALAS